MGIEAGTLRTALSRLTSDGWVLRDREGRNSFYRLSESAQAEITAAAVDIYAPPVNGEIREWVMASGDQAPIGGIEIAANTWLLAAGNLPDLSEHVCVKGALTAFPHGLTKQVLSAAHKDALAALNNDIEALKRVDLSPLDAMAARMLLFHRWRRIVLRFPDIPPALFAPDAVLPNPRQAMADIYQQLLEASENWLESAEHGLAPNASQRSRFYTSVWEIAKLPRRHRWVGAVICNTEASVFSLWGYLSGTNRASKWCIETIYRPFMAYYGGLIITVRPCYG